MVSPSPTPDDGNRHPDRVPVPRGLSGAEALAARLDRPMGALGALEQPTPGRFIWTSPLRGRYEVRPEPVLPAAPGIRPGPDDPEHDLPAPPGPDRLILWKPDPPPPADADPIDLVGPTPF